MNAPIVIIGAGVVGLAIAERLQRPGRDVIVLERHAAIGTETSSRNSEVIHAGLYYPPGSLKATTCVEGRERLIAFCERHRVPWRATGKLIVATEAAEIAELDRIARRATENGAVALAALTAAEVKARAPRVHAVAALWSSGTGIVDSHVLMQRLRACAEHAGATVLCRHSVDAAEKAPHGWTLTVTDPSGTRALLPCAFVVNSAGLRAGLVARLATPDAADLPHIVPVKGSYFAIAGLPPADTLVYPVPHPGLVGLGAHLTLDLAGRARLGPDIEVLSEAALEGGASAACGVDPARRQSFFDAARRFLPDLRLDDLHPDYAGVRPKLAADRFADFYLAEESARGAPGWVNLLGIESPGLTAALALADRTARLLGL